LKYEKLDTREIPVLADLSLDLEQQYMLNDEVRIEPNEITVFAPKRILDTLQNIYTEPVRLKKVKDSMLVAAKLKPVKDVRFSTTNVNLRINVEMFTEKQVQIPVTIINCPRDVTIKTFPGIVDARCNVGFSYFNSVTMNDIQAIFDYRDIQKNDGAVKIKLTSRSTVPHVSNIQLSPEEVEFIIEK
jgi:YbbR domain-containing protein